VTAGPVSAAQGTSGRASPRTLPVAERRPIRPETARLLYQPLFVLAFLLSSVVFIEPAPFDLLTVMLGVALFLRRPLRLLPFQRPAGVLLGAFLLVNFGTVMASDHTVHALRYLMITVFVGLVFLTVIAYANATERPERVVTVMMRAWVVTAVLTALLGSLAYFGVSPLSFLLRFGRIQGLFKDPNVYGPFLIPPLLYLVARLLTAHRLQARHLAAILVLALGVALSFSRAAWINAVVATALLLILMALFRARLAVRPAFLRLVPLLLLVGASSLVVLAQPSTRAFLEERSRLQGYDSERFATQAEAVSSLLASPLGIGPGEVELTFNYATHSSYARTAAEYGVPGLLLLFAFLAFSVFMALRSARAGSVVHMLALAALVGLLINSAVVDTIHWRHFWVVLALCWLPIGLPEDDDAPRAVNAPALETP